MTKAELEKRVEQLEYACDAWRALARFREDQRDYWRLIAEHEHKDRWLGLRPVR